MHISVLVFMCTCTCACPQTATHLCMSTDENAVRHACLIASLFTWSGMTANYSTANLSACLTAWQMEMLVPHFNQSHPRAPWCAPPTEAEVLSYIIRDLARGRPGDKKLISWCHIMYSPHTPVILCVSGLMCWVSLGSARMLTLTAAACKTLVNVYLACSSCIYRSHLRSTGK